MFPSLSHTAKYLTFFYKLIIDKKTFTGFGTNHNNYIIAI